MYSWSINVTLSIGINNNNRNSNEGMISILACTSYLQEEANQGHSVNYDVELFHSIDAYIQIDHLGLLSESNGLTSASAEGGIYRTLRLTWCTPSGKNTSNQFPNCFGVYRTTTASVNGRPSACLTSFLLSGKSVLLEVVRKSATAAISISPNINNRLISHMLIAHDGVIHIHCLNLCPGI
jgi:hypothetical protein